MRKYRVVEIVTPEGMVYAVERRILGMFWVQLDRYNNLLVVNRADFGIYDDKEIAQDAMAQFISEEEFRHAIANNRRVI